MKKVITIIIIIISIIAVGLPIAYAINNGVEQRFFEVEETKVTQGNDIIMNLNLDCIESDIFKVNIATSIQDGKFNINNEGNINVTTQNSNNIELEINKVEFSGVNKIALYYNIPKETQIGTIITLNADILVDDEIILTQSISVEVVENTENKDNTQGNENDVNNKDEEINKNNGQINMENEPTNKSNISNTMTEQSDKSSSRTSTTQTNQMSSSNISVYNGSGNNYLSSIEITGYELTPDFSKTNDTYFLTVGNDIENIEINAIVEDGNASLCIYGNTELVEGNNKVLICVTAENGNVRTYRIYVTRES